MDGLSALIKAQQRCFRPRRAGLPCSPTNCSARCLASTARENVGRAHTSLQYNELTLRAVSAKWEGSKALFQAAEQEAELNHRHTSVFSQSALYGR